MRLEIMGPPGAGKGTQASRLAAVLAVPHISTGAMFRDNISRHTPVGSQAEVIVKAGSLVPDQVVSEMVDARLDGEDCRPGFLLDGFPRTPAQVEALDAMLERRGWQRDAVVSLAVPEAELVRRLAARRTCTDCGAVARARPGNGAGRCATCGGDLRQRDDDREVVIRERLKIYGRQTAPVLSIYRERGLLVEVAGTGSESEVLGRIQAALAEAAA